MSIRDYRATDFILVLSAVLWHGVASAAQYGTNAVADAFVTTGATGSLRDNNYGGAGSLGLSAAGSLQGDFQSVLAFDLSGARHMFDSQFGAGLWAVASVSLQLASAGPNNPIFNPNSAGLFGVQW